MVKLGTSFTAMAIPKVTSADNHLVFCSQGKKWSSTRTPVRGFSKLFLFDMLKYLRGASVLVFPR
jgi:hypothetical protein